MRARFFGPEASTSSNLNRLRRDLPGYRHEWLDIRDRGAVEALFAHFDRATGAVVHAAAQTFHDWAAREPHTALDINAVGMFNLLEAFRLARVGSRGNA